MASSSRSQIVLCLRFGTLAKVTGAGVFGLWLVASSGAHAAADCQAWPGEQQPLPTVSDSDPYLARWSELRAEELRTLAERWAYERPAAAATLRAHAACLAPRQGTAKRAPTVRITRAGRPFPKVASIDSSVPPPAGLPATTVPSRAELQDSAVSPPGSAPATEKPDVPATEKPYEVVLKDSPAGPATGEVRILGQRADSPFERGQERPTGAATSAPAPPELAPTDAPAVDPTVAQPPRRKDPRVGREKPFPPPRRLDPRRLADESPAAAPTQPALASELARPDVAAAPEVSPAPSSSSATPSSSDPRRAEDARRAMREAIVAAGARARAEQARRPRVTRPAAPAKPPLVQPSAAPRAREASTANATPDPKTAVQRPAVVARIEAPQAAPVAGPLRPPEVAAPAAKPDAAPPAVSSPPSLSGGTGLDRVREEVRQARFESALELARELRDNLEGPQAAPVRAELEVLAATAALALGRENEARQYFGSAITAAPDLELDSQNHSPKVRALFDTVRAGTSP